MDAALELDEAVNKLTRPHPARELDAEGNVHFVMVDPLLDQLRREIGSTMAASEFKASGGAPIPIAADALDLWMKIDSVTMEHWWILHGYHFGTGRGTLVSRLRVWAMAARATPDTLREAAAIIPQWVDAIRTLLEPVRHWDITGACPECTAVNVIGQLGDDEPVKRPALSVVFNRTGHISKAVCAACAHEWQGAAVIELARAIGTMPEGIAIPEP
jgi:hypothetical protein